MSPTVAIVTSSRNLNLEPSDRDGPGPIEVEPSTALATSHGDDVAFLALQEVDWDFADADVAHGGHAALPYPCKFPPQVPEVLISALSVPDDLILDCFSGSGTTALEAVRSGRRALALDANPLAALLTRVKALPPSARTRRRLTTRAEELIADVSSRHCGHDCDALRSAPQIPNRAKWYADCAYHELAHLRLEIDTERRVARDVLDLALAQTAARMSFQESETRYVSRPRDIHPGETLTAFLSEVVRLNERLGKRVPHASAMTVLGDARVRCNYPVDDASVNLVVTSPPYPNAYDYHLYHRFRILWLREEPADLRRVEIGSHLRHQSIVDPIGDYERDMTSVLAVIGDLLVPGGHCAFVVGDGLYAGELYPTVDRLAELGSDSGFLPIARYERKLPKSRRSVTSAGRRLTSESILIFRKPSLPLRIPTRYQAFGYEEELAQRELDAMHSASNLAPDSLRRLAFSSGVVLAGRQSSTWQHLIEDNGSARKKNSTYASHGLHRYKGKFYPQLAKCLLNISREIDGIVLDPFAGSGTVALEASLLGIRSHSIELNPVGAAIARAKVESLSLPPAFLREMGASIADHTRGRLRGCDWTQFPPESRDEVSSWFAPRVASRLARLLAAIRDVARKGPADRVEALRLVGEVVASDLIRSASHQEDSDLRIRRTATPHEDFPLESAFLERWNLLVDRLEHVAEVRALGMPALGVASFERGDSRALEIWPDSCSTVVTSPPYAAALPYIDTDRLSLAAVFGWPKQSRRELESALIGSREISGSSHTEMFTAISSMSLTEELPASTRNFLFDLAGRVASDPDAGFRKQQTPSVLAKYFIAMNDVFRNIRNRVTDNGHVWFVVGDSFTTVAGQRITIPTTDELVSVAIENGLGLADVTPITVTRESLRNSHNAIVRNSILHFRPT